jgi:hypothetical protein
MAPSSWPIPDALERKMERAWLELAVVAPLQEAERPQHPTAHPA